MEETQIKLEKLLAQQETEGKETEEIQQENDDNYSTSSSTLKMDEEIPEDEEISEPTDNERSGIFYIDMMPVEVVIGEDPPPAITKPVYLEDRTRRRRHKYVSWQCCTLMFPNELSTFQSLEELEQRLRDANGHTYFKTRRKDESDERIEAPQNCVSYINEL